MIKDVYRNMETNQYLTYMLWTKREFSHLSIKYIISGETLTPGNNY